MPQTVWATVVDGKIVLQEAVPLHEGDRVLVTVLPVDEDASFWLNASKQSLAEIWDNPQDDVYGQLLER